MPSDRSASPRRRLVLALLAVVVIICGLLVHAFVPGTPGDVGGDALYAVLAYLVVAVVLGRVRPVLAGVIALALCTGVELLQLTGIPRVAAETFPPASLLLGTGFDVRDLVVYAVAVLAASVADRVLTRGVTRRDTLEGALPKESAL